MARQHLKGVANMNVKLDERIKLFLFAYETGNFDEFDESSVEELLLDVLDERTELLEKLKAVEVNKTSS